MGIIRLVEVIDDLLHSSLYHVFELLERPELMFWVDDRWSVTECEDAEDCDVFTLSSAITVTKQVLSGARYLHSKSIVHKDIKPNNIGLVQQISSRDCWRPRGTFESMLDADGTAARGNSALETVKIYDFGCAEICGSPDSISKKLMVYSAGGT